MSILVTGGAGFIGSHIVDKLVDKGYSVIIADNLVTGNIHNINSNAKFYKVDIRDPNLEAIFEENVIDYVFHEAAQASVNKSIEDPYNDMTVNIMGSLNLFRLCKKHAVKKTIIASTAAVYGNPIYLPVDEKHSTEMLSFYGLSKFTMENYLKMLDIDYLIFRYSNVYGPRQDANGEAGVISIFIDKMLKKEPLEIHGTGKQVRDFIYVEDVATANILGIETAIKNEIINLSTNTHSNIIDLVYTLQNISGAEIPISFTKPREGDIEHSTLDNSKAKDFLKWKCTVPLHKGLEKTLKWKEKLMAIHR